MNPAKTLSMKSLTRRILRAAGLMLVMACAMPAATPQFVSITPASGYSKAGDGEQVSFSLTFSDSGGSAGIRFVQLLINSQLNGETGCYLAWDRQSSSVVLLYANNGWLGLPGSQTATNSYCTLYAQGSSMSEAGNNVTVTWRVSFPATSGGYRPLWELAADGDLYGGWYQAGYTTIDRKPALVSVSATPGSGTGAKFTSQITDPDGTGDIALTQLLIASQLDGAAGCYVSYDRSSNKMALQYATSGGEVTPGANQTASNAKCTLRGTGSSASPLANPLTVTWNIDFNASAFNGVKTLWGMTTDYGNWWDGWRGMGTFSIPKSVSPPAAMSMSWKGITYSPRRHSFPRMLFEWNNIDGGRRVKDMVADDLTLLAANQFNLLHLYLWDKEQLGGVTGGEPAGFADPPGDPRGDPQWTALSEFINFARDRGLYVLLHFASRTLTDGALAAGSAGSPEAAQAAANDFVTWAGYFIDEFRTRGNVIGWGFNWSFQPSWTVPNGPYNVAWQKAYQGLETRIASQGLLGADIAWELQPLPNHPNSDPHAQDVIARSGGYRWKYGDVQRTAKQMRDLLGKDPDFYMLQIYHANASDLQDGMTKLTTGTVNYDGSATNGISIPPGKIFAVEFATSSALPVAAGGELPSFYFGDNNTPTATADGQAEWLRGTLCALHTVGIRKFAYWTLYDPVTFWTSAPYNVSGNDLAWQGYWGLAFEPEAQGNKPAWDVLRNYYTTGQPDGCSARPPVLAITSSAEYYTVGQPVRLTWSAANVTSRLVAPGGTALDITTVPPPMSGLPSYSCRAGQSFNPADDRLEGSCASADLQPFAVTGNQTITVQAISNSNVASSLTRTVEIGSASVINAVQPDYGVQATITANGTLIARGKGFSLTGGNSLQFTRPGFADVWAYAGDGYYWWDQSHSEIWIGLGNRLSPGSWNVTVRNGYNNGAPSVPFPFVVNP